MELSLLTSAVLVLGACYLAFGLLGRRFACNPAHDVLFSRPMALDLGYCVLGVFYAGLVPFGAVLVFEWVFHADARRALALLDHGYGGLSRAPLGLQVGMLVAGLDLGQYWLHRAFHWRRLWPFHAIHHSAEEVNWTTGFRVHPVNYLLSNTVLAIATRVLGLSPLAYVLAAPCPVLVAMLAHANLNWTYGPLKYVFVGPVFHRWHHSTRPELREANFATIFSFWDLLFGTFRMPGGRPDRYGANGVPDGIFGQLLYPFHRRSGASRLDPR